MDIISEIRDMIAEAESSHNNGYIKEYYRDKLVMLKKILDDALFEHDTYEHIRVTPKTVWKEEEYGMRVDKLIYEIERIE